MAGPNASHGAPADAAAFGDVVVATVRWPDAGAALADPSLKAALSGKPLVSCINPFKQDFSAMAVGAETSGAEEIARMVPEAHVVECLFLGASIINSPSRQFDGEKPSVFFCGDDEGSKRHVQSLIEELGVEAVDAGPLRNARFLEPYNMMLMQLGLLGGWKTDYALKLLRR